MSIKKFIPFRCIHQLPMKFAHEFFLQSPLGWNDEKFFSLTMAAARRASVSKGQMISRAGGSVSSPTVRYRKPRTRAEYGLRRAERLAEHAEVRNTNHVA